MAVWKTIIYFILFKPTVVIDTYTWKVSLLSTVYFIRSTVLDIYILF